uniref:Integrase catalytic domain-containing protein n=1 Tax=Anopheles atroparvus TaxID=41427 RepID=A0AAG5DS52_ANOAO
MNLSPIDRRQFVSEKKLCYNCLRMGHILSGCRSKHTWRRCRRRHHTLLHLEETNSPPGPSSGIAVSSAVAEAGKRHQTFLLTAIVNVVDNFGIEHSARALIDSGSQPNLISQRLAKILRIKGSKANISIQGVSKASETVRESLNVKIRSKRSDYQCSMNFLVISKFPAELPTQFIFTESWKTPQHILLADPEFNKPQPIDLVLGIEHYFTFFTGAPLIRLGPDLPQLVESVFGWMVAGSAPVEASRVETTSTITICSSVVSLEESMERFWKTEQLQMRDGYSPEERRCEKLYTASTDRDETGRYIVRLPRRPDFEARLGSSRESALRRFELLEKRLEKNCALKAEYHKFMQEYLQLRHMRLVNTDEKEPATTYYLPHHPVFKESSTTTKLRVVFDGSSKTSSGYSLNESLCKGPVVQDELLDLLLRFRTYEVALVGDVEKMYRQVKLHPDDCALVRIFFRFSPQDPVQVYELCTVTYGLTPSSFLATRTLLQLADDEGSAYPLADSALRRNFYVDDLIGGAQSIEGAKKLRSELSALLSKGGFDLRKWTSNRLEVLSGLAEDQLGNKSSLHFDSHETVKALGVSWKPESDTLHFDCHIQTPSDEEVSTKRTALSNIARLFDPLGMLAPVIVCAKIIMQEMWMSACGWDVPLPESIRKRWMSFWAELPALEHYAVPRCTFLPLAANIEIHTFADASIAAFGACSYVRCEDATGKVQIALISAKSKVAPVKRVSIARLELNACVLASHLHHRVKKTIDVHVDASFFWTDSSICLHWIRATPSTWKTYVANRVSEIQHFTDGHVWNHIAGVENPADIVSRGLSVPEFLESSVWRKGPAWLSLPRSSWPISTPAEIKENDVMESNTAVLTILEHARCNEIFIRWSEYRRLVSRVAYCLRFIRKTRNRLRGIITVVDSSDILPEVLTTEELAEADDCLVRLAQQDGFAAEIKDLKNGKQLKKQSSLRRLTPFLDGKGIMRVGGRLNLANLPFQSKHPALLPRDHPFPRLLAEHQHQILLHGGGRLLLSSIRERYWPLQGRMLVKSVVRRCFRCMRSQPVAAQQQMGQLPACRVTPGRPFAVTGIFCFATKAVHLELVGDLSTQGFIAALRRFTCRRGVPEHLHSDNGKNFEGAKNELLELFGRFESEQEQSRISTACAEQGITWHMIPPRAPHFGGLWEAA